MKALLVISFGTTFNDTREKTIDRIEEDLRKAFPDRKFYRAWTSGFIRKKLLSRDGTEIDGPEEAFERMKADGVTDVIVQPTHIIMGAEFGKIIRTVKDASQKIEKVSMGLPLLCTEEDMEETVNGIISHFDDIDDKALILMGHGSPGGPNDIYVRLEETFHKMGHDNVFIGTVEAEPGLDDMVSAAEKCGRKHVVLAPLLVVAGDHATNDLAGDEPDSWKSVFKSKGFEVTCVVKGLGEYEEIRQIFIRHAKETTESVLYYDEK